MEAHLWKLELKLTPIHTFLIDHISHQQFFPLISIQNPKVTFPGTALNRNKLGLYLPTITIFIINCEMKEPKIGLSGKRLNQMVKICVTFKFEKFWRITLRIV